MPKQLVSTQPDLFEKTPPETTMALSPAQRTSVLEQLQTLLIEAMATKESVSEVGDDQDQA